MKAWRLGFVLMALMGLLLCAAPAGAAENLLKNGSFEEGKEPSSWEQDVWNHGDTYSKFQTVTEGARSGGRAVLIESLRENDAKLVQTVKVKENTLYRLSGWIRAESAGTGAKGANLSVMGSLETSADYADTHGQWQFVELYGRTGAKQKELKAAVRLGGYGSLNKGKAYFDDIVLEEVGSAPAGAKVISFMEEQAPASSGGTPAEVTTGTPFKLIAYALAFFALYAAAYILLFRQERLSRYGSRGLRSLVLALLAAGLVSRYLLAPVITGHTGDMNTFEAWARHAATAGIAHFYDTDMFVDYPPGYIYVLYLVGKLLGAFHLLPGSKAAVVLLKTPAMLADLATAFLLFRMAASRLRPGAAFGIALLYVFNPAVLVNSAVWGQVDSFFTFFLLLAFLAVAGGKLERGGALFALAVLIKPQALIFTPVLLFAYYREGSWRRFLHSALWGAGVFLAGILPYSFTVEPFWFIHLYRETLQSYPYATLNAFNLYALAVGNWKPQEDTFLLFSYQTWGTVFIVVAVGLAFYYFRRARHHLDGLPYYLALVLISTVFLFGAKMHERYWFPALALVLIVFMHLKDRRILNVFLGLTVCQFLNVALTLDFFLKGTVQVPPKDGVLLLVSFASLVLFGFLLKIGYDGFIAGRTLPVRDPEAEADIAASALKDALSQGEAEEQERKPLFTALDWKLLAGLTLVYTVIAMYHLGSTKAPETVWEPAVTGESFTIDFGSAKHLERINSYAEIGEGKLKLEFAADAPQNWTQPQTLDVVYTKFFTWNVQKTDLTARYVKLTVETGGFSLNELAFFEKDGQAPIPVKAIEAGSMTKPVRGSVEQLFDEPGDSPYHPTYMDGSYFDEIYHPRTAYEHLHNIKPYENTHPPLGKLIIAVGIKLFGMNPFGWRIMGTLFGIAMIPLMYAFGKRIFGGTLYAFMAAFLFTFDFMHFAQTRIGTIDTYGVFFIILMYYYMYCYVNMSFYREPLSRTIRPLFLSGLFFGIGAASKWIVIYGGAGLAILLFLSLYRRFREYEAAKQELAAGSLRAPEKREALERITRLFIPGFWKTVLWCIPFFVIIPGILYSASFIPYMTVPGEGFSLHHLIQYQKDMWNYHSKLVATHGFASPWWEWPFIIKPIWFYSGQALLPEGQVSSIVSMGNPLVWWLGSLAVLIVIVMNAKRRNLGMTVVLTAFFSQYLPWMLVTRLTFIYHYFAMVPFLVLCLVYVMKRLNDDYKVSRKVNVIFMAAVFVLFVLFYPVLSGMVVDKDYVRYTLRWFGSWFFYS
ncbi:glycosyltransferase family 39 protein [Gorillibacterium sp. sgz5001074]|uniref:glycosyltransferase family 39 protein n=1 Tax=Gorillibacterium sp. sgz5001074 TaxID=3446695 RepID=UPI003F67E958